MECMIPIMRIIWLSACCLSLVTIGLCFDPSEQDDGLAVVRSFERFERPSGAEIRDRIEPLPGETISLIGGTEVFQMRQEPQLEMALQTAYPGRQLQVRNLGWSADTVYRQQRPMFFYTETGDQREGSFPDGRDKVKPGLLLLFFGKMESLDGVGRLEGFESAYERLILELKQLTGRILLIAPVPFSNTGPAAELSEQRNEVLEEYSRAISQLARRHGLGHVELGEFGEGDFGRGGIHFSPAGQEKAANRLARAMGWNGHQNQKLIPLIEEKDQLWEQYYRPTNWAFLYGDRQHVPSSRGHRDGNRRWFEEELESIPPLLESTESMIWQAAKGGQR